MEDELVKSVLNCPECGGKMSFQGYRPLFPVCVECGETFFIGKCAFSGKD